jgi:hypothetical protein
MSDVARQESVGTNSMFPLSILAREKPRRSCRAALAAIGNRSTSLAVGKPRQEKLRD